jgi:hypothetical protein
MKSSVFRPVDREEAHPHACTEGVVYLTYTAYDEEVGDEVERIEVVPCRRCSEVEGAGGYLLLIQGIWRAGAFSRGRRGGGSGL